ncbi:MAG: hypothetical protein ACOYB1_18565 [Limnohabitans sp.]
MRGLIAVLLLTLTVILCVGAVYYDGIQEIKANAKHLQTSIPDDLKAEFSSKLEGK